MTIDAEERTPMPPEPVAAAAFPGWKEHPARLQRAMKPDAQGFDEIRIVTAPRFKESELSGDEWRISSVIQFYRKGVLVHEANGGRNVESATMLLGHAFLTACDDALGYFAGERDACDQEGCSSRGTIALRLKKGFNRDGTERPLSRGGEYRLFCGRHRVRGDCGLEDADDNYEAIPTPSENT